MVGQKASVGQRLPNFHFSIFIRGVSGMGGEHGMYLEDAEGSLSDTWRLGSSLTILLILFHPKEGTLKFLC